MKLFKIPKQFISFVILLGMIISLSASSPNIKAVNAAQSPEQPYAKYWFPEQLLKWTPESDVYNVSYIPLAKRIDKNKLTASNDTQSKDIEVVAISIMNSSTSGNPSQGSNKFLSNTFSYWQYIDKLVYWGGSSGEGIIVPPSADIIDSSHKNGVPVLGTVFFPQEEHGGKIEWLNQVLDKKSDGSFPIADKLIEVANTYKFDGWFINQETVGGNEQTSILMQEFIKYFKSKAPTLEIMWYDSMTDTGEIDWQNALNEKNQMFLIDNGEDVSDSMFLNFWWNTEKLASEELLKVSNQNARELGINPFTLFAGIDTQANGTGTKVDWALMEGENDYYTSIGLYCPSWTFFSSDSAEEFLQKEEQLWVTGKDDWRGISTYAIEKSPVTQLPFVTNFSMGNGKYYFANGKEVSKTEWNNRSLHDIMPTYRWDIESKIDTLKANIDYTDAYNGGNSISISGRLDKNNPSTVKLFAADLKLENKTKFSSAIKTNSKDIKVNLILDFYDNTKATIEPDKLLPNQWYEAQFDTSSYSGKQIKNISFEISSNSDLSNAKVNIGNISIINSIYDKAEGANGVKVKKVYTEDNINADVAIEIDDNKLNKYEIYYVTQAGDKFVGATVNPNYYIQDIKRENKDATANFKLVSINENGLRSEPVNFSFNWGEYPAPTAEFSCDKTLINVGEAVNFKNLSSESTESITWTFEGGNITQTSDPNPSVTYNKEGIYNVKLAVSNSTASNILTKEKLITVVSGTEIKEATLKSATATSFVNEKEAPEFAIDDSIETKWCAVGDGPHAITIDLGQNFNIGEIDISHAGAGGENKDFNTKAYTISVSKDGTNFEEVLKVTDNSSDVTKDPIKVTNARYVKLAIDKATQGGDTATRIYDIKVIGYK